MKAVAGNAGEERRCHMAPHYTIALSVSPTTTLSQLEQQEGFAVTEEARTRAYEDTKERARDAAEAFAGDDREKPWSAFTAAGRKLGVPEGVERAFTAVAEYRCDGHQPQLLEELVGVEHDLWWGTCEGIYGAYEDAFEEVASNYSLVDEEEENSQRQFLSDLVNEYLKPRRLKAGEKAGASPDILSRPESLSVFLSSQFFPTRLSRELELELAVEAASALGGARTGPALATALESFKAERTGLPPEDRVIVDAAAEASLARRFGRHHAERLLKPTTASERRRSFEPVGQKLLLKAADPAVGAGENTPLVDGLIPVASVGALIADYSMGKTWLLVHLAGCVAFGEPLFGRPTLKGPVIFVAAEGQRALWKRIAGWLVHHKKLSPDYTRFQLKQALHSRIIVAEDPPKFDDPDLERGLLNTIEDIAAKLVIFDTMGKSLGGDQAEDSNDVANQVTGLLSRVAEQTGVTAMFSHHSGHSDKSRARGASAWTQGVDFAYIVRGSSSDFAAGKAVILSPHKNRDDVWPDPEPFKLISVSARVDGKPFSTAAVEPATNELVLSPKARLFHFIEQHPGSGKGTVRTGTQGDNNAVDANLRELMEQGAIENRGPSTAHAYHAMPGWRITGTGKDVEYAGDDFLSPTDDAEPEDRQ